MRSFIVHTSHEILLGFQMKEEKIAIICSTYRRKRNAYIISE
jgi:hypothetical protein